MIGTHVRDLKAFVLSRAGHFFFVFGYLWLLLSVYALHNSVVLADWHLLGHLAPAMLKALVFTKFLLIGEHLGLAEGFEDKPLIWPILIKAALFSALLIGFDVVEVVVVNAIWPHAGPQSSDGIEPTDLRSALSFSFMAFVALIPFFGIREFSMVIGEDRMHDLLFRRHGKVPQT
ncbi:MAG TPA: hypothetical protein VGJ56_22710 [Reyranella sp.]|jgi:hypothetical protein